MSDVSRIPAARRVECEQCGDVIDATGTGTARLATAWVPNRSGGGPNALVEPVWHAGRYLCRFCLDARRRGLSWSQGRLFDLEPPS